MKLHEIFHTFEARSNPELNPRLSAIDQLRKYKDDPDIFISFTDVNKIGIYPLASDGETPIGIYAFPLKQSWLKYKVDDLDDLSTFPMIVYGRKYIQVLKWNGTGNFANISDYIYDDLAMDNAKLSKMFDDPSKGYSEVGYAMEDVKTRYPFYKLYKGVKKLVGGDYKKWNFVLQKLGYAGFNDDQGKGLIHGAEPLQAVFFSKSYIDHIDSILNNDYKTKETLRSEDPSNMTIDDMIMMTKQHHTRIQKFEPYIIRSEDALKIMGYIEAAKFKSGWPAAEPIISQNKYASHSYATKVIHRRFRLGEPVIKQDEHLWGDYIKHFGIKG